MIILPYPPSANIYWRVFRGHAVMSAQARAYKAQVGWMLKEAGITPTTAAVAVTLRVYRPRRIGDLDNVNKCLLDSLQGYAYENDSQITEIHAYRDDDPADPRVELEIVPLHFIAERKRKPIRHTGARRCNRGALKENTGDGNNNGPLCRDGQ